MEKATAEVEALSEGEEDGEEEEEIEEEEEEEKEYAIQPSSDMMTWEKVPIVKEEVDEHANTDPVHPSEKETETEKKEEEVEGEGEGEKAMPKEIQPEGVQEEEEKKDKPAIVITEETVAQVMKPVEEKMKSMIFYYWPMIPQTDFPRWEVKKAIMYVRWNFVGC